MSKYYGYTPLYRVNGQLGESIIMGKKACFDYAVFYVKNEQPYLLSYFKQYNEALDNFIEKSAYKFGVKCSTIRKYLTVFEQEIGEIKVIYKEKEII